MTADLIFAAGAIVLAYAILANRLFAFARPIREDVIGLSEKLANDPRLPPAQHRLIGFISRKLTGAWAAWALALMLPAVIAEELYCFLRFHRTTDLSQDAKLPADLQDKWDRLIRISVIATLCTSPAALMLFGFTIAVASFAESGAYLAGAALTKVAGRRAHNNDVCPPAHPA